MNGQSSVFTALKPVLALLHKASERNSLLTHPKRSLLELGGKMTSLVVLEEQLYAKEATAAAAKADGDMEGKKSSDSNYMVWQGNEFSLPQRDSHRSVALISCVGIPLISVVDDTPSSATNRACSLILAVLKKHPSLLNQFEQVRATIMRSETAASRDHDDEEEEGEEEIGDL